MTDIDKSIQGHSNHMDKMRKKYPKGSTHQDKKGNTVVNESRSKALEKAKGGKSHDVSKRSLPKNVRHALGSAIPAHLKDRVTKDKYGNISYRHD